MPSLAFNFAVHNTKEQKTHNLAIGLASDTLSNLLLTLEQYLPHSDIPLISKYYEKRKRDFLIGRSALNKAFAIHSGNEEQDPPHVAYGVFGQPFLPNNPLLDVAITHSSSNGIAVLYPKELFFGIDLEMKNKTSEPLLDFDPLEKSKFEQFNLDASVVDLVIWTIKESLGKAIKCGLGVSQNATHIESIHLEMEDPVKILKTTFKEFYFFNCFTLISGDYVLSFALPKFIVPCDLSKLASNLQNFL